MLRNIQGQNSAGYSGNLSDQAKKRTGIYQTASQPSIDTQAPRPQTGIAKAPQTGMASPSSNLQSPSVPGTVNIAGTQAQIPMRSSGKSGGFNKGPVVPTPVAPTPGIITPLAPTAPPKAPEWKPFDWSYGGGEMGGVQGAPSDSWVHWGPGEGRTPPSGWGSNQRPLGKPMTLRDAFSTLQTAGYGSF